MSYDQKDIRFNFKTVICGASSVGKTCLFNRYCFNSFNFDASPTIGINFHSVYLKINLSKEPDTLKENYPHLIPEYSNIYKKDIWGSPVSSYQESIHKTFNTISKKYKIPRRIPASLFKDILSENDLVRVILEHLEYLLKLEGKESSYRWTANSIAKLNEPLSKMKKDLRRINGVGPTTERIILEILETGTSSYYEKLLTG